MVRIPIMGWAFLHARLILILAASLQEEKGSLFSSL